MSLVYRGLKLACISSRCVAASILKRPSFPKAGATVLSSSPQHLHPARLELGPDAAKIVGVVRETLEANPDRLLVMCPQIFQMNGKS